MAADATARLTAAEGRRFGVTVGLAFVAIGLAMLWRGHHGRAMVASGIGALGIVAGLTIPTRLGPVERAWMRLAHAISRVTTPIFMGIVYFLVLTPIGIIRTRFGDSPIRQRGGWEPRAPNESERERMERQF